MNLKKIARRKLLGESRCIRIKNNKNFAFVNWSTPVVILDNNSPPKLKGLPYLKTTFSRNGFSKTLYTPSTFRIEVGKNWIEDIYNNDDH